MKLYFIKLIYKSTFFRLISQTSSNENELTWTKVYFIIAFLCLFNRSQSSLCNVNDINDEFAILSEFNKASNIMPEYVKNITYEAYTSGLDSRSEVLKQVNRNSVQYYLNYVTLISVFTLVLVISFLLNVLVRQQKRIRAPVWFPPLGDNHYSNLLYCILLNFKTNLPESKQYI